MSMKFLPLLNFDETFANSPNKRIVPCDVNSFTSKKQVGDFMRYIFSDGDIGVSLSASCECGCLTGKYLIGTVCQICKTEVVRPTATNLQYTSWIQIPEFVPPLLQPAAYRILKVWMGTYNKESLLRSLMTTGGVIPPQIAEKFTPGLWNFYNNFDMLIHMLLTEYKPLKEPDDNNKSKTINDKSIYIREFVTKYRSCLFARYFPILDKSMHVLNNQGTMSFVDKSSELILKTVIELANIHYSYVEGGEDQASKNKNMPFIEQCTLDMIDAYYEYSEVILTTKLQKKLGLIRRHILGSRCHFTFRGVIVPITDGSYGDELHLPWGIGVQQHKLEILNILVNRKGFSPHEAQMVYEKAKYKYEPLVDEILLTLIEECPFKGLPCIIGRNPTL